MLDDVRVVLKRLGLFFESDHLPYNIFHKPLDLTASGLGKYCVDAGKTMRSLVGGGMASTMPDEDNNINAMTNLRNTNAAAAIVSQTTRANELVLLWRDRYPIEVLLVGALPQSPAIIGCYCNAIDLAASFTHYTVAGSKKGTFGHGTTLKVDNR